MAGRRRQVIHVMPAILRRSLIRAEVIMPRSPTMIICSMPNVPRTACTASGNVFGSPVLPAKTRTATGRPSRLVSRPYSIWALPRLPSREYPNAASSQCVPSTQEEDRSNIAIPPSRR